jgi:hypothetical protein
VSSSGGSAFAGEGVDDFEGCTHPFRGAAFHEALEILRAMFTGEVDGALGHAFITAEGSVLPDLPIGIGTEEVLIDDGCRERGAAVPFSRDAWKDRLELAQEGAGIGSDLRIGIGARVWRGRLEGARRVAAGIV